jgi:hypothetical protein
MKNNQVKKICLVACASQKVSQATLAQELYISPLFKKSKFVAERYFDKWFILSAKHGLVSPGTQLKPYNFTLNNFSRSEKNKWGQNTFKQLLEIIKPGDSISFFAGENYREHLEPLLTQYGVKVSTPMNGLSIGRQLS